MVQLSQGRKSGVADPNAKVTPDSVLKAPRAPVTRWRRPLIITGAAIVASLVAMGFVFGFSGPAKPKPRDETQAKPTDVTPPAPSLGSRYANGYASPEMQVIAANGTSSVGPAGGAPGTASLPSPADAAPGQAFRQQSASASPQPSPEVQHARAEVVAARASSPFFGGSGGSGEARQPEPGTPTLIPVSAEPALPQGQDVQPANGQGAKRQFLNTARSQDYLATPLRAPLSPWEVQAGSIIPAALITAINSDLPGEVVAQVTQPVYDHATGRTVLIPQGSRLIGVYDAQVAYGQQRALIAWTRLVMPDGRSINIGSMSGSDLSGAAGLQDQVDGHFGQLARGIFLSSVFSVGAASAQDAGSRSSGELVINSAAAGAANSAQQVGQQITQRDLSRQPTLKIRAGFPLTVLVNKDMILAPYP
jgi:type IV secretion system protein VirB10